MNSTAALAEVNASLAAPAPDSEAIHMAQAPVYFSYDPDDGIEFHDTPQQAELRAHQAKHAAEFYAADSDGYMDDNQGDISWGQVFGHIYINDRPPTAEEKQDHPDWEYVRELEWVDTHPRHFATPPLPNLGPVSCPYPARAPTKPVTVTDAPAVTGSLPFDRAGIIALLECMREFAPHGVPFKAGYRNAISILCSYIEQQLTDDQLGQAGEDPAGLTLGAHLAATRRHFQILA